MAWTVTYPKKSTMGDLKMNCIHVLTDGAESNLQSGLHNVLGYSLGYCSMTAITYTIHKNKGSTSTALVGVLGCSGFTSGDEFDIIVFGT